MANKSESRKTKKGGGQNLWGREPGNTDHQKKQFMHCLVVTNVEFFKLFEETFESQTRHFE